MTDQSNSLASTNKAEHTPTPWSYEYQNDTGPGDESYGEWYSIEPAIGDIYAKEDAAFIVTACNSHSSLVAIANLMLLNIRGRPSKLGEPNWKYLTGEIEKALKAAGREDLI